MTRILPVAERVAVFMMKMIMVLCVVIAICLKAVHFCAQTLLSCTVTAVATFRSYMQRHGNSFSVTLNTMEWNTTVQYDDYNTEQLHVTFPFIA
jgi:hypothetical protein